MYTSRGNEKKRGSISGRGGETIFRAGERVQVRDLAQLNEKEKKFERALY